jgi:hypothetical protein
MNELIDVKFSAGLNHPKIGPTIIPSKSKNKVNGYPLRSDNNFRNTPRSRIIPMDATANAT